MVAMALLTTPLVYCSYLALGSLSPVLGIRMVLGLPDPDPEPLVRGMDPGPASAPDPDLSLFS